MIIDLKTGRIAYHSILLREEGGTDFIQYDFYGKEIGRYEYSAPLTHYELEANP